MVGVGTMSRWLLGAALGLGAVLGLSQAGTGVARAAAPAPTFAVREAFDLRYFPGKGRQTLDVFAPRGRTGAPVVLFVHGGTWMFGDKNFFGHYRSVGRYLARHGVVAVLINYRLSPRVRHPEHVKDVARAFAWTRANAARFGGDADRIFLAGHSAGGHLAALLATDASYLGDAALKLKPADRAALRGVMAVSGVYRVPGEGEYKEMVRHLVHHWVPAEEHARVAGVLRAPLRMAGGAVNPFRLVFGDEQAREGASPLAHVRAGLPPFLLLYAAAEVPGLPGMAEEFAKALKKAGTAVEVREVANRNHRNIVFQLGAPGDVVGRALLDFVARHANDGPAKVGS